MSLAPGCLALGCGFWLRSKCVRYFPDLGAYDMKGTLLGS